VALSAGDQVLLTAGAHANVVDELVDLHAIREHGRWTAEQEARYRDLRKAEHDLRKSHAAALRRFLVYRRNRERLRVPIEIEPDDATIAVVAHGLLGAVGVIQGAATMLIGRRDTLPAEKQGELLAMIEEQAGLLGGVLQDMVRGLPPVLQHHGVHAVAGSHTA
jgi:K+-sensing histidine kinase KdpD